MVLQGFVSWGGSAKKPSSDAAAVQSAAARRCRGPSPPWPSAAALSTAPPRLDRPRLAATAQPVGGLAGTSGNRVAVLAARVYCRGRRDGCECGDGALTADSVQSARCRRGAQPASSPMRRQRAGARPAAPRRRSARAEARQRHLARAEPATAAAVAASPAAPAAAACCGTPGSAAGGTARGARGAECGASALRGGGSYTRQLPLLWRTSRGVVHQGGLRAGRGWSKTAGLSSRARAARAAPTCPPARPPARLREGRQSRGNPLGLPRTLLLASGLLAPPAAAAPRPWTARAAHSAGAKLLSQRRRQLGLRLRPAGLCEAQGPARPPARPQTARETSACSSCIDTGPGHAPAGGPAGRDSNKAARHIVDMPMCQILRGWAQGECTHTGPSAHREGMQSYCGKSFRVETLERGGESLKKKFILGFTPCKPLKAAVDCCHCLSEQGEHARTVHHGAGGAAGRRLPLAGRRLPLAAKGT